MPPDPVFFGKILWYGPPSPALTELEQNLAVAQITLVQTDNLPQLIGLALDKPDMWVCDMAAVGLRYQEFYTLLQEQPTLSRLAFVVITKADEVALRVKLLTLGALDFLTAPLKPERCAIRLQTHLAALQNSSQQSDQMHQKIRTVIHDLRNPLGILVGYTEYLLEALDELSPTEQKYVLEKMRLGEQKMDDLIDMLMEDV